MKKVMSQTCVPAQSVPKGHRVCSYTVGPSKINRTAVAGMVIMFPALAAATAYGQELVLTEKLRKLQADKDSFTLVDVRDTDEFQRRHIDGAINLPKDTIRADNLPKGVKIILYCGDARCSLSHAAAKTLMAAGVENVGVLYGGIAQWEKSGYPVSPASAENAKPQGDIDAGELQARMQESGAIVVVDVRPAKEFGAGHLPSALSIPLEKLSKAVKTLRKSSEIVLYDRLPQRSKTAVRQLAEAGLAARSLSGGIGAWAMKGYPLEAGAGKGL